MPRSKLDTIMTDALSPCVAAQAYLDSVPRATRRDEGQVYTPASLVEFILDLGGYDPGRPVESLTLLDPACGAGVFLTAAVERLARRLKGHGVKLRSDAGLHALCEAVEAGVIGVDKDSHACDLARRAVWLKVREITGGEPSAELFRANVVEGDFLLGGLEGLRHTSFDFIVGNPPYVATTRLSDRQKDDLRARFAVANGRIDLYTLFFERALRLLAPAGRVAFITPNKYLLSESAKKLRRTILASARLCSVASFRSHRVFDGAATVPCVTVLERASAPATFELLECSVAPGGRGPVVVESRAKVSHPKGGEQPWFLGDPALLALARRVQDGHRTLGEVASRISAGVATGRDQIFVLKNGAGQDLEPELRRPAVRGQDLHAFRVAAARLEVILPYLPASHGRPALVDLDDFPRTKAYLEAHRAELEARHCVRVWGKAWYDVHDPWTLDITGLTKVLVPDVACSNRFALDRGTSCPLHSAYYVVPKDVDPVYLTAVLNASPTEFLVRLLAPVVKDGFSRYRRQFLVTLPVPRVTNATRFDVVTAVETGDYPKADDLVCRLFGLTREDLRAMAHFLARVRDVHGAAGSASTVRMFA